MLGKILDVFYGRADEVELTVTNSNGPAPRRRLRDYIYVQHGLSQEDYNRVTIDHPASNEISMTELIDYHKKNPHV